MLANISKTLRRLIRDEDGHVLVEYGLILFSIAVLCILAVRSIGGKTGNMFGNIRDTYPAR